MLQLWTIWIGTVVFFSFGDDVNAHELCDESYLLTSPVDGFVEYLADLDISLPAATGRQIAFFKNALKNIEGRIPDVATDLDTALNDLEHEDLLFGAVAFVWTPSTILQLQQIRLERAQLQSLEELSDKQHTQRRAIAEFSNDFQAKSVGMSNSVGVSTAIASQNSAHSAMEGIADSAKDSGGLNVQDRIHAKRAHDLMQETKDEYRRYQNIYEDRGDEIVSILNNHRQLQMDSIDESNTIAKEKLKQALDELTIRELMSRAESRMQYLYCGKQCQVKKFLVMKNQWVGRGDPIACIINDNR